MEEEQKTYELIESFLEGTLDPKGKRLFDQRMADDPTFAEQVELHREIAEVVSDHDEVAFEHTLLDLREEMQAEGAGSGSGSGSGSVKVPRKVGARRLIFGVAAVVILLVAVWVIFESQQKPPTPQELFTEHFEPYEVPNRFRGTVPAGKMEVAFEPYQEGDFAAALKEFEVLDKDYPNDEEVMFFAGVCELALGNTVESREYMEKVLALPDNQSELQGKWYMALSWLLEGEIEEAQRMFKELTGYQNRYYDQSKILLDILL